MDNRKKKGYVHGNDLFCMYAFSVLDTLAPFPCHKGGPLFTNIPLQKIHWYHKNKSEEGIVNACFCIVFVVCNVVIGKV